MQFMNARGYKISVADIPEYNLDKRRQILERVRSRPFADMPVKKLSNTTTLSKDLIFSLTWHPTFANLGIQ
eukprot:9102581-Karenia_brevis.AAC.1